MRPQPSGAMPVALGLKARIGRAVLVAVGAEGQNLRLVDRRELRLLPEGDFAPYHAVEGLSRAEAEHRLERSIAAAKRLAGEAIADAQSRIERAGHRLHACGVLVGPPIPAWTTAEILAVHVRMHQAEGELFRTVLVEAAQVLGLDVSPLPSRDPHQAAAVALRVPERRLSGWLAELGSQAGPPWAEHQKEAALASLVALAQASKTRIR